ncbi:MAG: hypothetical protein NC221_02535 [Duncaniella sp.]|nr:hypothetical protein [Duncaniella sp.]
MKFYTAILQFLSLKFPLLLAVVLWSCSSDIDQPSDPVSPEGVAVARVEFFMTVGDNAGSVSRTTPTDGSYDPGSGYENYINLAGNDFQVLFFSGEDNGSESKFLNKLELIGITVEGETTSSKTYRVLGRVPQKMLRDADFRVVILANWGEYPTLVAEETTLDQLCANQNATFEFNQAATEIGAENPIPMYGVKKFGKVVFDDAGYGNLGTLHLLRAYAKVDVMVHSEVSERWKISSASITYAAGKGYKAPANVYDESDYVHNSYTSDYTDSPNIPADNETVTNLLFTKVSDTPSTYRIYIPEYRNVNADGTQVATPARIAVNFVDKNTNLPSFLGEQFIDFKYYVAPSGNSELKNKPFNVMRNYWYKFEVKKIDEIAGLDVNLDVQPYASVELDPGFGLKRDPIDGYIILHETQQEDSIFPTFLYDDRYSNYYDYQKYMLASNYSKNGMARLTETQKADLGLSGDILIVKRANHYHDEVGDDAGVPSLLYCTETGVYYDFRGDPLNLRYKHTEPTSTDTETILFDVERDFHYNDIVISSGDNSVESSYYDFAHGNYKGAFNPDKSVACDEELTGVNKRPDNDSKVNFYRAKTFRRTGGWIEIVPYWLIQDTRVCRLYYNIFTRRYYDKDGYCLQAPEYEETFEFNVGDTYPYVVLDIDSDDNPTLVYERSTGEYYSVASGVYNKIDRPSTLVKDSRLPWPPAALAGD